MKKEPQLTERTKLVNKLILHWLGIWQFRCPFFVLARYSRKWRSMANSKNETANLNSFFVLFLRFMFMCRLSNSSQNAWNTKKYLRIDCLEILRQLLIVDEWKKCLDPYNERINWYKYGPNILRRITLIFHTSFSWSYTLDLHNVGLQFDQPFPRI